jgi:hypothetical protein
LKNLRQQTEQRVRKKRKRKKRGREYKKKQEQKEGKLKTYLRIDGLHSERRRKRRRSQAGQPL